MLCGYLLPLCALQNTETGWTQVMWRTPPYMSCEEGHQAGKRSHIENTCYFPTPLWAGLFLRASRGGRLRPCPEVPVCFPSGGSRLTLPAGSWLAHWRPGPGQGHNAMCRLDGPLCAQPENPVSDLSPAPQASGGQHLPRQQSLQRQPDRAHPRSACPCVWAGTGQSLP